MQETSEIDRATVSRQPQGLPVAVRALVACGWLTESQAVGPGLTIASLHRSHVISRVTAPDGRTVVVKHPSEHAAKSGRDLLRELFVYRLGSWIPAVGSVLLRPLFIDETRQILVLPMVATAPNDGWPPRQSSPAISQVATRLGEAMAAWHVATAEVAMWQSMAEGVLHLPDNLEDATAARSPSGRSFLQALVADERCANGLREARAAYRHECLIHGDIRSDNWLLAAGDGGADLKIIDWEMAGLGDPAWDVASVLAEAFLEGIRRGVLQDSGESGWPAYVQPSASTFARAYASTRTVTFDWDTVVLFTSARLMHVASEWAENDVDVDLAGASLVLDHARGLLDRRSMSAMRAEAWGTP